MEPTFCGKKIQFSANDESKHDHQLVSSIITCQSEAHKK